MIHAYLRRSFLEINTLSVTWGFRSSQVKISPGAQYLAYTLQLGPDEACCGRIRDLSNGSFLQTGNLESVVSLEWVDEGNTLLYTLPDALGRPYKVC